MSSVNIPFDAIVKLIEYMEHDEREHFEEMLDNGEDVTDPGHIYLSVKAVTDWLADRGITWRNPHAEMMEKFEAIFAKHGVLVVDEN
jgi:hypothetical protein